MISAVLDTNTIVSGILGYRNPQSIPGELLRLWHKDEFILVTSKQIRTEVKEVLHKAHFTTHLTPQEISRIQSLLQYHAKQVFITENVHNIATHPEDDLVLATAVSAKAEYLVTGDKPLRQKVGDTYNRVNLVTPNEFLHILREKS